MLQDYDRFDSVLPIGDCTMESVVGECRVKVSLLDEISRWKCIVEVNFHSIRLIEESCSVSRKDAYDEATESMECRINELCNNLRNLKRMLWINEF